MRVGRRNELVRRKAQAALDRSGAGKEADQQPHSTGSHIFLMRSLLAASQRQRKDQPTEDEMGSETSFVHRVVLYVFWRLLTFCYLFPEIKLKFLERHFNSPMSSSKQASAMMLA